jgi:hypothetical protein
MNMRISGRIEAAEKGGMYPSNGLESNDFGKIPASEIFFFDIGIHQLSIRIISECIIYLYRVIEKLLNGLFQQAVSPGFVFLGLFSSFQLRGFDLQGRTHGEIPDIPGRN